MPRVRRRITLDVTLGDDWYAADDQELVDAVHTAMVTSVGDLDQVDDVWVAALPCRWPAETVGGAR